MRELHVSTQTTPVELAAFLNQLLPEEEVGGRPGAEGCVVLYSCSDAPNAEAYCSMRSAVAARVAIDVVVQQAAGMPGAQPLLMNLREQFAGNVPPKAGWLAPPLTVLARVYRKTVSAMPPGMARIGMLQPCIAPLDDPDDAAQDTLSCDQQQALETLLERLVALAGLSKIPGKT